MGSSTFTDRMLATLKNNRYVAVVIVAATIIVSVGKFTDAGKNLIELIFPPSPPVYRALVADLGSLEKVLNNLANSRVEGAAIGIEVQLVHQALERVCAKKDDIAQLKDEYVRSKLDEICIADTLMKNFSDPQKSEDPGKASRALAAVMAEKVRKLREKLASKV